MVRTETSGTDIAALEASARLLCHARHMGENRPGSHRLHLRGLIVAVAFILIAAAVGWSLHIWYHPRTIVVAPMLMIR
jgi:hypothetical protein